MASLIGINSCVNSPNGAHLFSSFNQITNSVILYFLVINLILTILELWPEITVHSAFPPLNKGGIVFSEHQRRNQLAFFGKTLKDKSEFQKPYTSRSEQSLHTGHTLGFSLAQTSFDTESHINRHYAVELHNRRNDKNAKMGILHNRRRTGP
jgi:hypothetical protein